MESDIRDELKLYRLERRLKWALSGLIAGGIILIAVLVMLLKGYLE